MKPGPCHKGLAPLVGLDPSGPTPFWDKDTGAGSVRDEQWPEGSGFDTEDSEQTAR